eukprot:3268094-Rhodomonas_salina.1
MLRGRSLVSGGRHRQTQPKHAQTNADKQQAAILSEQSGGILGGSRSEGRCGSVRVLRPHPMPAPDMALLTHSVHYVTVRTDHGTPHARHPSCKPCMSGPDMASLTHAAHGACRARWSRSGAS